LIRCTERAYAPRRWPVYISAIEVTRMAKQKKGGKGKKKRRGKRLTGKALAGTIAGGLLGKVLEKLLTDIVEDFVLPQHHKAKHAGGHDGGGHKHHRDVAALLLDALADGGPKPVATLLAETKAALTPALEALRTLREFRLINVIGADGEECVEATRSGAHAATVLRQSDIRHEAKKLLEA
jgi:hypothetical protein